MAEERRHRRVSAQHGAVHLDELARHLPACPLELVDAAREARLARARGAHQEDGFLRGDGDLLDALDQAVEGRVGRIDTSLQERDPFPFLEAKAGRDPVVPGEVEVDDAVMSRDAGLALAGWRGLHELPGKVVRLGEQE